MNDWTLRFTFTAHKKARLVDARLHVAQQRLQEEAADEQRHAYMAFEPEGAYAETAQARRAAGGGGGSSGGGGSCGSALPRDSLRMRKRQMADNSPSPTRFVA